MNNLGDRILWEVLSQVDFSVMENKMLCLSIPGEVNDLEEYEKQYRTLFFRVNYSEQRNNVMRFVTGEDSPTTDNFEPYLNKYFSSLRSFIPIRNKKLALLEKELTPPAVTKLRKELIDALPKIVEEDNGESLAHIIADEVALLSRQTDDRYMVSTGRIFLHILYHIDLIGNSLYVPGLVALGVKHSDRKSNMEDLDRKEHLKMIEAKGNKYRFKYFHFDPFLTDEGRKDSFDLSPFYTGHIFRREEHVKKKKKKSKTGRIRRVSRVMAYSAENLNLNILARKKLSQDDARDIVNLLSIPKEQMGERGVRALEQEIYRITKKNNQFHRIDSNREREADIKSRLKPQTRIHNMYKSAIIMSQDGLFFEILKGLGKEIPLDILYGRRDLGKISQERSQKLVEGVFSNHCITGSRLNYSEAHRIVEMHRRYVESGGYEAITRKPGNWSADKFALDGLVLGFFDARAKGEKSPINFVYRKKDFMFGTGIALNHLFRKLLKDDRDYIRGMGFEGFNPERAIEEKVKVVSKSLDENISEKVVGDEVENSFKE